MTELIETERSYVKDLETAVNCFLKPMQKAGEDRDKIPVPLRGKEHIIFGNVEEILGFHKQIFKPNEVKAPPSKSYLSS